MCACELPSAEPVCVGDILALGGRSPGSAAADFICKAPLCVCRWLWLCKCLPENISCPAACTRVFFRGCGGQTFFFSPAAANTYTIALTHPYAWLGQRAAATTRTTTAQRNDNDTVSGRPRPIRGEIIFRIFSTKLHINVVVQTNFYFRIFQLRFHLFLSIKFACTQKQNKNETKNKSINKNQPLKLELENHKEILTQKPVDRSCVSSKKQKAKKEKENQKEPVQTAKESKTTFTGKPNLVTKTDS